MLDHRLLKKIKKNYKITGSVTQVNINNITCDNCRIKGTMDQTTVMFRCNFCSMEQKFLKLDNFL